MKILLSGASGFLGSALSTYLEKRSFQISRLVRTEKEHSPNTIYWNPAEERLRTQDLEGFDAVVHLAAESIASGLWTDAQKERIRLSRVQGTSLLARMLSACDAPPSVFISASAVGYYGSRGSEVLTEQSPKGIGFLSDVCEAWEAAANELESVGARVVQARFGIVLDPSGGLLAKLLPPFRLGLGGRLGSGAQYMSWIALHDVLRAVEFCLTSSAMTGPVNVVAPEPITNAQFTKALGSALHRPTLIPAPAFLLKLLPGNMAEEMLLSSARVLPHKLLAERFVFSAPNIEAAFEQMFDGSAK